MYQGSALQTFLRFLHTKKPCKANKVSLINEESTQNTLKKAKSIPHKTLVHGREGSDLWIFHPNGIDNIYSQRTILFFEFDPSLELFPTLPSKQRSSL